MLCAARHDAAGDPALPCRGNLPRLAWQLSILVALSAASGAALAADDRSSSAEPTTMQIAERLLTTTVTVRYSTPTPTLTPKPAEREATPQQSGAQATPSGNSRSPASGLAPFPKVGLAPRSSRPAGAETKPPAAPPATDQSPAAASIDDKQQPATPPPQIGGLRLTPGMVGRLRFGITPQISVCSGVSLGNGLVVTFARATPATQFRVTLADGEQARASLVVQDQYSGLCLLQTDAQGLPTLEFATAPPAIGAWLMTAAASGIDQPLISQGLVGGVDRVPRGTQLPPLLQCDLRTTETSCGSPVVDRQGRLVGIVAAVSDSPENEGDAQAGWTFVVPARYIARLLAARLDHEVVTLQRQRPSLGLTLVPGEEPGTVRVERVDRGGPAEAAGIRAGDWILETDGRKIRSPYQVMSLVQRRQPGEKIAFVIVAGDGQARQLTVTLASALPDANPNPSNAKLIEPRAGARVSEDNRIEVMRRGKIAELGVDLKPRPAPVAAGNPDQRQLEQLAAFEQAILQLRAQLKQRDEKLTETDQRIERLKAEIELLKGKQPQP